MPFPSYQSGPNALVLALLLKTPIRAPLRFDTYVPSHLLSPHRHTLSAFRGLACPADLLFYLIRSVPNLQAPCFQILRLIGERKNLQPNRSEEHTSELQSRENLVCRLLL